MAPAFQRLSDRASPWLTSEALFAIARIAAGGYAAGTFAYYVRVTPQTLDRAILRNALLDGEQKQLSLTLAVGLALAVAYVLFFAWRGARRNSDDASRELIAASFEPFLLTPLAFWPLYEANVVPHVRLMAIVVMAGLGGFALHLFATRSPRGKIIDTLDGLITVRMGIFAALAMGLAHGIMMARVSVMNFEILFSGWDLAIYSQVHWNITTTGIPWSTVYTDQTFNHYAIHFSPIYHLTSLLYMLHRAPPTLLVIENVALGLGALPVYALAKRFTGRATVGLMIAAAYLLNPCAHGLGLHDFHEIVLFVPLMLALIWATEIEHRKLIWLFVALVLLIREDTPAYVAVFGVYLWIAGKREVGRRILVVAVVYLVLVHGAIMPFLRGGTSYVFDDRYSGLVRAGKTGKGSVVETLATNATYTLSYVFGLGDKWEFVSLVFVPVAFLPLVSKRALILLVPGFAFSVLSSFSAQYSIEYHYTAPILPFLYFTTIVALGRWERPRMSFVLASVALLATCLLAGKIGRSPILNPMVMHQADEHRQIYGAHGPAIHRAAESLPKDACVRATGNLLVAVSERKRAYIVPWGKDCDWAFLDYSPQARQAPSTNAEEYAYMLERLRSGAFGITYLDDRVVLMGRGQPTERNAELVTRLELLASPVGPR